MNIVKRISKSYPSVSYPLRKQLQLTHRTSTLVYLCYKKLISYLCIPHLNSTTLEEGQPMRQNVHVAQLVKRGRLRQAIDAVKPLKLIIYIPLPAYNFSLELFALEKYLSNVQLVKYSGKDTSA